MTLWKNASEQIVIKAKENKVLQDKLLEDLTEDNIKILDEINSEYPDGIDFSIDEENKEIDELNLKLFQLKEDCCLE